MEIIVKGQLPSEKEYTATCNSCKTKFKFKRDEARYQSDQREGDYLSITCPLPGCNHSVTVAVSTRSSSYWDDR